MGLKTQTLDALYTLNTESPRINVGKALVAPAMAARGVVDEFEEACAALKRCGAIRNKYAHQQLGVFAGELKICDPRGRFAPETDFEWTALPLPLLERQLAYFAYTRECLLFIEDQFSNRLGFKFPAKIPMP